jgi:hypothetical protein
MATELKQNEIDRVADAVRGAELTRFAAWQDLDALSTHTHLDGIDIDPESVKRTGNKITGSVSVYVVLHYGGKEDEVIVGESFPGKFLAHMKDKKVIIDDITVDTSGFYQ